MTRLIEALLKKQEFDLESIGWSNIQTEPRCSTGWAGVA
jgi:hypothetical protein